MEPRSFTHVSGPLAGDRVLLVRLPVTIGSGPDADVVVPGTAPRHAVVFPREGQVVLLDSGSDEGTFVGGERIQEVALRTGDVVQLGSSGPRLRFEQETPAHSGPSGPPMSQTLALRIMAQSSRSARRTLAVVGVLGVFVLGWSWQENRRVTAELNTLRQAMGRVESERRDLERRVEAERSASDDQRAILARRLEDYRDREAELRTQLADAASGEVQSLKTELDTTRQRIATLETERAAGEQIIRQYGGGVALIQGAYAFYDADRRPMRYRSTSAEEQEGDDADLSAEGEGPIHVVEYYGTGFLVEKGGLVLTNRHVAQPWWNDAAAAELQRQGFEPRFQYLRAFFPRHKDPYELRLERVSNSVDLALVRTATPTVNIPVLPLEREPKRTQPGQPVVVVGYPTGLEAILAKAESTVVREILESHGTDSSMVTVALARQNLIRPSTTQGHIGDITGSDIVFDAPSAQGGSGGPVFNKHGQVIAVEYAVLQRFGGNAFGIPIAFAHELLRTARRGGD